MINFSKKETNKIVPIIILLLLVAGGAYYISSNNFAFTPLSGITLLGLNNVGVINTYQGTVGPWWYGTAIMGGSQQIYVNGLGQPASISTTAQALSQSNSSYTGSQSKQDTLNFQLLQNQLIYQATLSSGTQFRQYRIQPAPTSLTYNTCGAFGYYSTNANQGVNTTINCWTIDGYGGQAQVINNYENACISASTASVSYFPLITSSQIPTSGTLSNLLSQPITFGCFEYVSTAVANLYQFQSPVYNSTVQITVNNDNIKINSLNSQTQTSPDGYLIGTYINNQPSVQVAPYATSVSAVQFFNGTQSHVVNFISGSALSSYQSGIVNHFAGFKNTTYQSAVQFLATENGHIEGLAFNQSGLQGQFQNAQVVFSSGLIQDVVINDNSAQYSRPMVQVLVKAQQLGLLLATSSIKVSSFSVGNFNSGSTGQATLVIINNGTASGAYTAQLTNVPSGVQVSGGQQQQTINAGQPATFYWSISSASQNLQNISQSIGAQICQTYGNQCVNIQTQFVQGSICNNNAIYCNPVTHNATNPVITPGNGQGQPNNVNQSSTGGGNTVTPNYYGWYAIVGILVIVILALALKGGRGRMRTPRHRHGGIK